MLGGRYRILGSLGAGSVGAVYEVEHVDLGVRFALKALTPQLVGQPGIAERFLREARLAAAFADPRFVRVTDFGWIDELPYLVMERLEGRTFGAAVASGGKRSRDSRARTREGSSTGT
mgnify:CR=1 FL=1